MKMFEVRPGATPDERQLWLRYESGLAQAATVIHRANGWQVDAGHQLGGSTMRSAPGITELRGGTVGELLDALGRELGGAEFTEV